MNDHRIEENLDLYTVIRSLREDCIDASQNKWQEKVISRLFYCVRIKDHVKPSEFEEEIETFINEQRGIGNKITGFLIRNKLNFLHFMEMEGSEVIENYLR